MKVLLTLLYIAFTGSAAYAELQGREKIDSLLKEMSHQQEDTAKVILLLELSKTYGYEGALTDANDALALAKQLNWEQGIALSYFNFGRFYRKQTNYPKALENLLLALPMFHALGDKLKEGWTLNYIGKTYFDQADFTSAQDYFLKCLKIFEEVGDKYSIAGTLNDIANVNWERKNYTQAYEYYTKAATLFDESGRINGSAMVRISLGDYYTKVGDYKNALDQYSTSLRMYKWVTNKSDNLAYAYTSVSRFYRSVATDGAENGLNAVLKCSRTDALMISKDYLDSALAISVEVGENPAPIYKDYSELYAEMGNYKVALDYHKRYTKLKDSLFSAENYKKFNELTMQLIYDKKQDSTKRVLAQIEAKQQAKEKKQTTIIYSVVAGLALVIFFLFFVQKERKKAESLLLNILPAEVAEELKEKGSADAKQFKNATVLFADIKDFTQLSEKLSPTELVNEINTCFSAFDTIMEKHGVEKIKTIGDAYMAVGGLPKINNTHAEDVVSAALEIQQFMAQHKREREVTGRLYFEVRIGVHTGPVVAGIVGIKKFAYDIWGDTVNTASRMESSGTAGKVNISEITYEQVKEKFNCEYRGEVEAKGKGVMKMYFVS